MIGSADRVTCVYDIIIILIKMLMSLDESSYRYGSLTVRSLKMLFLFNRFELTWANHSSEMTNCCLSDRLFRHYVKHDLSKQKWI